MNEPSGELVELDFYFGNRDRVNSLRSVIDFCCANEGRLSGYVLVNESAGMKHRSFRSIYDRRTRVHNVISASELSEKFSDPNIDVAKVGVWGAIGLSKKAPEIITYCGVSKEASNYDSPAVAIIGEGWQFSTPGFEQKAKKLGHLCYKRFVNACMSLNPSYAAILNEDSLPCKFDLSMGRGSRCFLDFFVSSRVYADAKLSIIRDLYHNAYTEMTENGLYVSTSGFYNPERRDLGADLSLRLSAEVARLVAQ